MPAGACRERARSTICRWRGCCGRARPSGRRRHRLRRRCSISAWSSRSCSRRSTSIRRKARRGSPSAVIRETLAAGGRACRPLIARDGLGATLIEPALAHAGSSAARSCGWSINCARCALPTSASRRSISAARPSRSPPTTPSFWRCRPMSRRRWCADLDGADRISRHRQRAFPHRAAGRHAADPRRAQRHGGMDLRLSGPGLGHHQRRRPSGRRARATCWRRRSGAKSQPRPACRRRLPPWQIVRERRATFAATPAQDAKRPGAANALAQSCAGRRLDRHRPAGHHRRRDPLRQPRRRPSSQGYAMIDQTSSTTQHSSSATRGAARPPAPRRPLGVRARGRRHHSGRICAAAALSRRAGRCRARSQDRRLSAPHPGRARRLAAVRRRRSRRQRDGEGLFRAEDDRRFHRCRSHAPRARGGAAPAAAPRAPMCSRASCWRCSDSFPGARCR